MSLLHPTHHNRSSFPTQNGRAGVNHPAPSNVGQQEDFATQDGFQAQANTILDRRDALLAALKNLDNSPLDQNPAVGTVVLSSPKDSQLARAAYGIDSTFVEGRFPSTRGPPDRRDRARKPGVGHQWKQDDHHAGRKRQWLRRKSGAAPADDPYEHRRIQSQNHSVGSGERQGPVSKHRRIERLGRAHPTSAPIAGPERSCRRPEPRRPRRTRLPDPEPGPAGARQI